MKRKKGNISRFRIKRTRWDEMKRQERENDDDGIIETEFIKQLKKIKKGNGAIKEICGKYRDRAVHLC